MYKANFVGAYSTTFEGNDCICGPYVSCGSRVLQFLTDPDVYIYVVLVITLQSMSQSQVIPYELPVAMGHCLVGGLDAGIRHGELWLQVHTSNTRSVEYQLCKCTVRTLESAHTLDAFNQNEMTRYDSHNISVSSQIL